MEKRKIGQTAESLSEKLIQLLKSGGGDIPIKELRELTSTMSEQEHEEYHRLLDALTQSGAAKFIPQVTKVGDKGLIISRRLRVREPLPHRPRSPLSPMIVKPRRASRSPITH